MARYGVYANRGRAHREAQAARLAAARQSGSWAYLEAAFEAFRAAARLQARRRPPLGVPGVHEARSSELAWQAAGYLAGLAADIDNGVYDAKKVA